MSTNTGGKNRLCNSLFYVYLSEYFCIIFMHINGFLCTDFVSEIEESNKEYICIPKDTARPLSKTAELTNHLLTVYQ